MVLSNQEALYVLFQEEIPRSTTPTRYVRKQKGQISGGLTTAVHWISEVTLPVSAQGGQNATRLQLLHS